MCPFIGFSLDYAAKSQIFETKGKKFYFKRNPQKCGIPQNEISHQKQDISSHMNYTSSCCIFKLFLVVLFFSIIYLFLDYNVHDTLTLPGNAIYLPQTLLQHLEVPN